MIDLALSVVSLARFQFAMTTIFHFFFVPFSIGMGLIVSIMETLYVIKKDEVYKHMTKFWSKIFLLSFAVGVVTGIIQEFQFGMNWSAYSRFVGDIFGAPLAVEALVAFFLESTFLGFWMFSWDKVKPALHVTFVWLVTIGSSLSALWILIANSFMQNPTGFILNKETGRAQLVNFADLLKNHQVWLEFPHVLIGAFLTAGFVVAGMSAMALLRKTQHTDFFRKSMKVGLIVGLVTTFGMLFTGDRHSLFLQDDQPMKFAATEGLYENVGGKNKSEPWAVIGWYNEKEHKPDFEINVPYVLSILAHHSLTGENKGANTINKELHEKYDKKFGKDMNYYVPFNAIFYAFRVMAVSAGAFLMVAVVGLWFNRKKHSDKFLMNQKWWLCIMSIVTFLPFAANTGGWLVTELGRYPWVVYGYLTIADAVSPNVSAASMLFSNIVYFLTFCTLGGVMVYYAARVLREGPDDVMKAKTVVKDPFAEEAFN
ncbi:cytochrome ubiquinol oxidase subunit I [Periweissella fabalis]|uniref:Cytochrome ubiquinol oxidase subunit I n=1 Tax=Periweissella fabalis TaxID=1070421 RepID=A0A7X6S378_9LACO|nr:cytochrome ubiquinol oxidase subunit I [Periweissella fabalis]MCM0598265.1 cytochrome ubiquinol oxidase subunit I [Periweissella fabalis]NKZ24800.1 cytochrome ubiquinol oxidase subunit I [Periweissella fabalis]